MNTESIKKRVLELVLEKNGPDSKMFGVVRNTYNSANHFEVYAYIFVEHELLDYVLPVLDGAERDDINEMETIQLLNEFGYRPLVKEISRELYDKIKEKIG